MKDAGLNHLVRHQVSWTTAKKTGVYDRIGSIEMFEAVGEAYWPSYFPTAARSIETKMVGRVCRS